MLASERGSASVAELLDTAVAGTGDVWQNLLEVDLAPQPEHARARWTAGRPMERRLESCYF